jgi:4-aminobutyrate aminotransferase
MGKHILNLMADWRERYKIVGDVRGKGLMIGVEIVRNQKTKEKAHDLRNRIIDLAFHKGLLILGAGENSVRLAPPLMIDTEQATFAVRTLGECISEIESSL